MSLYFKHILCISFFLLLSALAVHSQQIQYTVNPQTGAMKSLSIREDNRAMNWILETDGSQYKWVGQEYGWGLGSFCTLSGEDTLTHTWNTPVKITTTPGRMEAVYVAGGVHITVKRTLYKNNLLEEFVFQNNGALPIQLFNIGINTPFNDNYPDAATCYKARTNAHIWAGQSAAYVNAMHMSGRAPHLGLVLTKGSIPTYEIKERGREKDNSNTRGVIVLNPEDITLLPEQKYTLSWRIFTHQGPNDFERNLLLYGSVIGRSGKYVYQRGEDAHVVFEHPGTVKKAVITLNGKIVPHTLHRNTFVVDVMMPKEGEACFEMKYDKGKRTSLHCLVISSEENLIRERANFIVGHQQMNNESDKRYGAYMVYDNELDKIYLNDTPNCNPVDRDEGRERVGMGVLLAMLYQKNKDENLKSSLLRYSTFVHKLQDKDYNTFSNTDLTGWNRNYNYSWIANFYFEMFHVTADKQYLLDGYHTLKALYRNFGHGFYAIDMPTKGYQLLKDNGYPAEAASLLDDFRQIGDAYLKNSYNYPVSEVNYEQSIVAPSVTHLLRLYLLTKEQKYLDGAKEQLPLLESFGGRQPSYHLHEISIRHWDGYWFGKREFWGDTFPHYWSTLTALAYDLYAQATGDTSYRERAIHIVRNNLCLFFEDGKASCAFIYPNKVNGQKASFYDPYANDQDWALVYYLIVNPDQTLSRRRFAR